MGRGRLNKFDEQDSDEDLQGDQRQGKSGNFNSSFSNQGKSGKMDLFGENQGKIREFHNESGKKSGNFVIVFICYFYDFSKRKSLAPSALACLRFLKFFARAFGSDINLI